MITCGALLAQMFHSVTMMYVGFVAGFIVGYFLAQMIAEKSFGVLGKAKGILLYGGAMAVIYAMLAGGAYFDVTGYERYTPDPSDVKAVYISYNPNDYGAIASYDTSVDPYFIKTPQIVNEVETLHQNLVDNRAELRTIYKENYVGALNEPKQTVFIAYELNSGKIVQRKYLLTDSLARSFGVSSLMSEREVILAPYYSLKNPNRFDALELDAPYGNPNVRYADVTAAHIRTISFTDWDELNSLIPAIKDDLVASAALSAQTNIAMGWQIVGDTYSYGFGTGAKYLFNNLTLVSADNTIAWLTEHGYMLK